MESQVSLDSERYTHLENMSIQGKDPGVASSAPDCVEPKQPEKRPTRQWAAWTRQEEESFFTALRQVGKNFEKITRHVKSKNKDQVRHYYYRLVRRMNKLLGPGLCLDAKNSKDTNAAMLRWWSLLEKYSCKASKLHLKPRRFKIFIDALANQLLKDRRKNVRKRSSQGDSGSLTAPSIISNQNRGSGHDARTVKLVFVDSQNLQKLGGGKGSLKRNVNMGVIRSNNKGDSAVMKPTRQRRKPAAYKKWEKAAIAGVSLVADAAEHLERTATDKEIEDGQVTAGQKFLDPVEKVMPPLPASSLHYPECNAHPNMKLKLQLFPINDGTRRALEMDKHNPYLELTLSTRKKISSVLEHLNKKWGNSSVACGELVLFPYSANGENLVGYQRWTQDSHVGAGDVYSSIGSPPLFRLRYGWFSHSKFSTMQAPPSCIPDRENSKEKTVDAVSISEPSISEPSTNYLFEKLEDPHRDCPTSVDNNHASAPHTASNDKNGFTATGPRNNLLKSSEPAANTSMHRKESGDNTNVQQLEHEGGLRLSTGSALSAGEWADSLTNVSVGDLLSEVPHEANLNCIEQPIAQSDQCLQQIPFSCDSFDAAIAAHISRHQSKMGFLSIDASHTSSIWDAEETCDAFSFQKNHSLRKEDPTSSTIAFPHIGKQMVRTSSMASDAFVEELPDIEGPLDYLAGGDPMDECPSDPQVMDTQAKDFNGLTDIYWPDSLGLLDLDIPSSKYHSEDLILSDSLGGLSHLIASSLDAFQNCSFLGLNKKDSSSTVNARENATFSDFKIGGEL